MSPIELSIYDIYAQEENFFMKENNVVTIIQTDEN